MATRHASRDPAREERGSRANPWSRSPSRRARPLLGRAPPFRLTTRRAPTAKFRSARGGDLAPIRLAVRSMRRERRCVRRPEVASRPRVGCDLGYLRWD